MSIQQINYFLTFSFHGKLIPKTIFVNVSTSLVDKIQVIATAMSNQTIMNTLLPSVASSQSFTPPHTNAKMIILWNKYTFIVLEPHILISGSFLLGIIAITANIVQKITIYASP